MTDLHGTRHSFEAFNARYIRPDEIARTFVPPDAFSELLENNHSVLTGPRGSGKTTLLKMLTLEALAAWRDRERDAIVKRIPFLGIFVGADVLWATQANILLETAPNARSANEVRSLLFRIQVCLSCLDTLEFARALSAPADDPINTHRIDLSPQQEHQLVRALAGPWGVDPSVSSLWGLRAALRNEIACAEKYVRSGAGGSAPAPQSMGISWLSAVQAFVEMANGVTGRRRRWALLVDELEITFPTLRDEVFSALRSTYQDILFKLALFPHQSTKADEFFDSAPTSLNDYKPVFLWYSNKEKSYPFCERLFAMLSSRYLDNPKIDAADVLGNSIFDGGRSSRKDKRNPYAVGGDIHRLFASLATKDVAFLDYLDRRNVDINKMASMKEADQAAKVRKILPIVAVRDHFLKDVTVEGPSPSDGMQRRIRSTTGTELYAGAHSLFALSEGNPRIFINLVGPMIAQFAEYGGTGPVRPRTQATHIRAVIDRYKASIIGTPYSTVATGLNVMELVEAIGNTFHDYALGPKFNADFPLSFVVDENTDDVTRELLGRAINLGAIVPVTKDRGDSVLRNLNGFEFRLSFIFSPTYRLPISQSGRSVRLQTIASGGMSRRPHGHSTWARLSSEGDQLGLDF